MKLSIRKPELSIFALIAGNIGMIMFGMRFNLSTPIIVLLMIVLTVLFMGAVVDIKEE